MITEPSALLLGATVTLVERQSQPRVEKWRGYARKVDVHSLRGTLSGVCLERRSMMTASPTKVRHALHSLGGVGIPMRSSRSSLSEHAPSPSGAGTTHRAVFCLKACDCGRFSRVAEETDKSMLVDQATQMEGKQDKYKREGIKGGSKTQSIYR